MESIRVGVVFDEKDEILSDSQKSQGLERCWVLLKPQLQQTVSEFIDHVLQAFELRPSCPNGLILYMDGFVLPWFESTSILKDRDVISVRKKGITYSLEGNNASNLLMGNNASNPALEGNNASNLLMGNNASNPVLEGNNASNLLTGNNASNPVRGLEGVQKGAAQTGALLLANEEFEKETGGYQSDEPEDELKEEGEIPPDDLVDASKEGAGKDDTLHRSPQRNATSKKRKAGQNLERSKDKRRRSETQGSSENDPPAKQIENTNQHGLTVKKKHARKEKKVSKGKKKSSRKCTEVNEVSDAASETSESSDQAPQNEELKEASDKREKRSSRSARRKRAKRKFIQEMSKIQSMSCDTKMEGIQSWKQKSGKAEAKKHNNWRRRPVRVDGKEDDGQPKGLLHWNQSSQWDTPKDKRTDRDTNVNGNVINQSRQMDDSDGEVVPVVIKPGHIRFESLGKEIDVPEMCNQGPKEPRKWNGITSKKKGQKWGTERNSFSRRSNYKANGGPKTLVLPTDIHLDGPIEYEKFPIIDYMPKVGDVIGYRILQLTSNWTPEPSCFRVGHVSWCNDSTTTLVLTQIPGHSIIKPDEQESDMLPGDWPYKEDGSLEINFKGLLDVRLIKDSSEPSAEGVASQVNESSVDTENTDTPSSNLKGTDASTLGTVVENGEMQANGSGTGVENGEIHANGSANTENRVDAWEMLSEALNSKKDELSQENRTWEDVQKALPGKGKWSNAAVRCSALGPTIAYLRSKNQI